MIAIIVDYLAAFVITVISITSYGGIFILMLLESCGIPIPSEIIMPFSGFLVSDGVLSFWPVVVAGTVGNLIGSLCAYWIGAHGRPFLEKYGKYFLFSKHDLDIADRWFKKYGGLMVFGGRLLPAVRTYISFPAGIARMNIFKFSFYTLLGVAPWTILFAWLGVVMGEHWDLVREKLHDFDLAIIGCIIVAVAWYVWRHLKHTASEQNPSDDRPGVK